MRGETTRRLIDRVEKGPFKGTPFFSMLLYSFDIFIFLGLLSVRNDESIFQRVLLLQIRIWDCEILMVLHDNRLLDHVDQL